MSDSERESNNLPVLSSVKGYAMPKKCADIETFATKPSVASWLKSLRECQSRKNNLYGFAKFLRRRAARGVRPDPDSIMQECLDGNKRVLLE